MGSKKVARSEGDYWVIAAARNYCASDLEI